MAIDLFPIVIDSGYLGPAAVAEELKTQTMAARTSHYYSENTNVLAEYPQIAQQLEAIEQTYAEEHLGIRDQLYICLSWVNRYTAGDWVERHNHHNSIVSGCWYIDTPPTTIVFHKADAAQGAGWRTRLDLVSGPSRHVAIPVEQGQVLVWPSDLEHSVPLVCDGERWSLAFNTWVVGSWGSRFHRVNRA